MTIEGFLSRVADLIGRRRKLVAFGLLALTVCAVGLLPRLHIEPNVGTLFPGGNDIVELRRVLASRTVAYSANSLVLMIRGPELSDRMPGIEAALLDSPHLVGVTARKEQFAGPNLDAYRNAPLSFVSDQTLERLERRLTTERSGVLAELADQIAAAPLAGLEEARRDPLDLRGILGTTEMQGFPRELEADSPYLMIAGGEMAVVRVLGKSPFLDHDFSRTLLEDLDARLGPFRDDGIEIEMLGGYVASLEEDQRLREDLRISVVGSFALVLAFLLVSLRSAFDAALLGLATGLGIVWALGFGGAMLGPMAPLVVSGAAILAGLGVDFGVHFLGRYREESAAREPLVALRATMAHTGRPVLVGLMTTVAAFLTLTVSRWQGIRTFGILLAFGLVCVFVSTVSSILMFARLRPSKPLPRESPVIVAANRLLESRVRPALVIALVVAALVGWGGIAARGIEFDLDFRNMRPEGDLLIHAIEQFEEELLFSPSPIVVVVNGDLSLEESSRAVRRLEEAGTVSLSLGPHQTVPSDERRLRLEVFHGRTAGWVERSLEDLEDLGFVSDAFRDGLEELESTFRRTPRADLSSARISWRGQEHWVLGLHSRTTLWGPEDRAGFRQAVQQAFGRRVTMVALFGLTDELGPILIEDLTLCAGISGIAIVLVLLILTRRVTEMVIAISPMLVGMGITLGVVVWMGAALNVYNFVAIPLIGSIGIDDGLHMLARYRESQPAGRVLSHAAVLRTTGMSLWRTSATTILAFGTLAACRTPGLASLGILLSTGLAACFVTSILLIPSLVELSAGRRQ